MTFDMTEIFFLWVWGLLSGLPIGVALAIFIARIENVKLGGGRS